MRRRRVTHPLNKHILRQLDKEIHLRLNQQQQHPRRHVPKSW